MQKNQTPKSAASHQLQLGGMAFYGPNNFFFAPDNQVPQLVEKFRRRGTAQQLSDGTFDFTPSPDKHSQATLIKKLSHGRVSDTKDGAIQLTLKVKKEENICISAAILEEALLAVVAIRAYQLKHSQA